MSDSTHNSSRRGFLTAAGMMAGAVAVGSGVGAGDALGADGQPQGATNALLPTQEQLKAFLALPDEQPVVMVNLLKFKPDGGAEEYAKYAAGIQPILEKLGAKILFAGKAEFCLIGQADWDMVALVQYPHKKTLLEMSVMPKYRKIHRHREAGLEGQINYAVAQTDPAAGS